jgi:hypothetical protein
MKHRISFLGMSLCAFGWISNGAAFAAGSEASLWREGSFLQNDVHVVTKRQRVTPSNLEARSRSFGLKIPTTGIISLEQAELGWNAAGGDNHRALAASSGGGGGFTDFAVGEVNTELIRVNTTGISNPCQSADDGVGNAYMKFTDNSQARTASGSWGNSTDVYPNSAHGLVYAICEDNGDTDGCSINETIVDTASYYYDLGFLTGSGPYTYTYDSSGMDVVTQGSYYDVVVVPAMWGGEPGMGDEYFVVKANNFSAAAHTICDNVYVPYLNKK